MTDKLLMCLNAGLVLCFGVCRSNHANHTGGRKKERPLVDLVDAQSLHRKFTASSSGYSIKAAVNSTIAMTRITWETKLSTFVVGMCESRGRGVYGSFSPTSLTAWNRLNRSPPVSHCVSTHGAVALDLKQQNLMFPCCCCCLILVTPVLPILRSSAPSSRLSPSCANMYAHHSDLSPETMRLH